MALLHWMILSETKTSRNGLEIGRKQLINVATENVGAVVPLYSVTLGLLLLIPSESSQFPGYQTLWFTLFKLYSPSKTMWMDSWMVLRLTKWIECVYVSLIAMAWTWLIFSSRWVFGKNENLSRFVILNQWNHLGHRATLTAGINFRHACLGVRKHCVTLRLLHSHSYEAFDYHVIVTDGRSSHTVAQPILVALLKFQGLGGLFKVWFFLARRNVISFDA